MKKLLTLFFALVASVGTLFAESGTCGANLTWDLTDGVLTISGTGDMTDYSLGAVPWNSYRENITSVTIGNGVTSIGEWAFCPCKNLTSVTIGNSVTSIGSRAFYWCTGLTNVTIPNSVTSIGDEAFFYCSGLTNVTIPNSVTSIGDGAFLGCSGLTSVMLNSNAIVSKAYTSNSNISSIFGTQVSEYIIGEDVTSIGNYAFSGCSGLTSVTIGNSVTSIGWDAFSGCTGLTSIEIPNSVTSIGDGAFAGCTGLTSIIIPNSVTSIGNDAFSFCTAMTSVTIGNGVTSIGDGAFFGCSGLTSVMLNSNAIVSKAYTSNSNISSMIGTRVTEYIIGEDVTSIGRSAFYNCPGLTSVTIGYNVTSIGENAFYNCSGLTSVHISDLAAWCGIAFSNNASNPLCYAHRLYLNNTEIKDLVIPNDVRSIGSYAFYSCTSLTSIIIPNSVTSIGWHAFSGCSGLTSVTIGNSVISIGSGAFYGCSGLTSIEIPNSVTSIGNRAFSGCSGLTSIQLSCNIQSIGVDAFPTNTTVIKDCGVKQSEDNLSICEGESLVWNTTKITSVKLSDSGDYEYKTKTILYDDSIATLHLTVNPKYNIVLPDTTLCYKEDLIIDGTKCTLSKVANKKQTWTRNLHTINGCDSIVNISVLWKKLPDFTITTKHVFDTPNSGSLSYAIDKSANYSGKYYYLLNGQKNASLSNLSAGQYRLVFYSEDCGDSIVRTVQINQYAMRVNNMYYLLDASNHTATLTYRGTSYDAYSGEYSGNITIPETISFEGQEYQVTEIGTDAFYGCNNIKSITMTSKTPISISNSCGLSSSTLIYVPYGSLAAYKSIKNWSKYNVHVINPSHSSSLSAATSVTITLGDEDEAKHIVSCGMEGGEEEFAGNIIEYIGLEPESQYADIPFYVKTREGDTDILSCSFTTSALELTTQESKPVSSNTAILLAETNMADIETSCGFEWKRNDAPEDMTPSKVLCPVANGQMAGRLKNLKDEVYYKYRAFYQSAAGNMFYGDWKYIFTGDVAVEFDPILYTYAAMAVKENEATLKGYALAGSEDFTEQGFEYWAESRANNAPRRTATSIGEHKTVTASGISLRTTLTDLDEGTVYKYRTYAKIGDKTLYGSEMAFTTQGEYQEGQAIEDIHMDASRATKILHNGQIYILRGEKIYTITGQKVR